MSKVKKVSSAGKVRAILIVWSFIFLSTLIYIHHNELTDKFHVDWLESKFFWVKSFFGLDIYENFHHFIIAFIINSLVYITIGLILGFIFYIIMNLSFFKGSLSKKKRNEKYIVLHKESSINYTPRLSLSKLMVIPSAKTNAVSIEDVDPIEESFFNLRSVKLKGINPATIYETFESEIFAILKAYHDVPASVSGHHGQTGLLSHSLSVTKNLLEIAKKEKFNDPLLRVIGLSHDIEKILAYKKKNGVWSLGSATHYHQLGIALLKTIPSYGLLSDGDRTTLGRVLRFIHSPERLPLGSTDRQKKIIELLKKADQAQTKREKSMSSNNIAGMASETEILNDVIISLIPDLNINESIRTGRADGWTMNALGYVVVVEENLRALLKEKGDPKLLSFLNLNIPFSKEGSHPATKAISETLIGAGLVLLKYGNIESKSGLFDLRNGSILFTGSFLLSKSAIKSHHPDLIEKWGSSKYRITVLGAHKAAENTLNN